MSECTKNSDRVCCYTCSHAGYSMEIMHKVCLLTMKKINEWDDGCDRHERPLTAGE